MTLRRKKPRFSSPFDAMSDLAFLLLIFIMLVSMMEKTEKSGVPLASPVVEKAASVDAALEIAVDRAGVIYLDGKTADLQSAETLLARRYRTRAAVILAADRETSFGEVSKIIALLQKLEYPAVSLAVKNAE
ncbi:MAG: biopolymer transporter ExbD [Treponema sp.]|nr:biopolymer transporter ExbD [Treponema sp.]